MVTGANGFLASWMVKMLLEKEAKVVALVYHKVSFSLFDLEGLQKHTHTIFGDILDFRSMKRLIKEFGIQTVFHVGAQAINKTAVEDPLETLETNIRGTYNILEAVRKVSPKTQVIVASSDKAYGIHKKMPYRESYPLHGEFPYEVSKSCADLISQAYFKTYDLPICVVRCGNIYGGGDWHFSRVVPATIISAYANKPPKLISETIREFTYAKDIARGYLLLSEKMNNGLKGEVFNFGSGKPIKTSELMKLILKLMNKSHLGLEDSNETRLEIPIQYLSIAKAKRKIGYNPKTSLNDGLQETIDWYISHIDKIKKAKKAD